MKKRKTLKKNLFHKLFIKFCRKIGYEIIDQGNYEVVTSEKKLNENISLLGKKSITAPTGKINITRKVKNLHIILRTCLLDEMLAQKKQRLFQEKKLEYVFRTLKSICNSVDLFKKDYPHFEIKITVLETRSEQDQIEKLKNFINTLNQKIYFETTNLEDFKNKIKNINSIKFFSYMSNVYNSFNIAKRENYDLIYFVDDDYLHKKNFINELIFTYEKISSITEKELFLCPADYPFLYFKPENTYILLGEKYHWRRVKESLCTFLTSKKMIEKNWDHLIKLVNNFNDPFEKPLHEIFENELCFSPIPSLSVHCANINSIFGIPPNINCEEIWNEADWNKEK